MKMLLLLLSFVCPALADHSLKCHNDYTNSFMCEWDTSVLNSSLPVQPESRCSLHIAIEKRISINKRRNKTKAEQMIADPAQPHIRRASVVFSSKAISSTARLYHEVWCENYSNPVAKAAVVKAEESVVKVSPPQAVGVHGLNASWSVIPSIFKPHKFEVQFRPAAQSWTLLVEEYLETELMLPEDRLLLHHLYVIQVRVKLQLRNAIWSDWSEEYSWTSDVGLQPATPTAPGVEEILNWSMSLSGVVLTGVTLTLIILFTVFIKCTGNKWSQRSHFSYIPDPSKFFGDLDSNHGGNFKSWLGPVLVRESFIKADGEMVSPVEVVKQKEDTCDSLAVHKKSGGLLDRWDTATKSSNFSNSTYFMSQSSKGPGDILEPCSAHSSYGPAGGISGPERLPQHSTDVEEKSGASELELTLQRLEKLRQDTQSPDSGFAGGAEDSIEEADLPSPVSTNLLPQDLLAPHPLLQPLLGLRCVAPALGLNFMIPALDLQSACGPIEPSSGDYMPVKSVQDDC